MVAIQIISAKLAILGFIKKKYFEIVKTMMP